MSLTFLTPAAALVALLAAVPLAVFLRRERHASRVAERLRLPQAPVRSRLPLLGSLVALPLLAGLAAAQPVLDLTRQRPERVDVEGYVVIDTSRSMLASRGAQGAQRFERARAVARELRTALPEVPLGLVSLTDRTLPHLFPTTDGAVFDSALARSLDVELPPPRLFFAERASELDALSGVLERNFFSPAATTRLLVVLSDGESRTYPDRFVLAAREAPGLRLLLVPVWGEDERVYVGGAPEPAYEPDPAGPATLGRIAADTGGLVVPEDAPARLASAAREAVGSGPTRAAAREGREVQLMPWVTALALLPLGVVLWRRNL